MKPGRKLEKHVQHIYDMLLNPKFEGIEVGHNVSIAGLTGAEHEYDVYYEFPMAGVPHRVGIECKDRGRPVDLGMVRNFKGQLDDTPGILGVMISANGYQSGAELYAKGNGILTLTTDELPSINVLLAERIKAIALPDESAVGEPFWSLYEIRDGEITGTIFDVGQGAKNGGLFFSKGQATRFLQDHNLGRNYAVRGLEQRHLRSFIMIIDMFNGKFMQSMVNTYSDGSIRWDWMEIPREFLISEWYVGHAPIPKEPMVAPDYHLL